MKATCGKVKAKAACVVLASKGRYLVFKLLLTKSVNKIVAKPVYLCARAAQNSDGRLARCVASRQGARSASHRVMQA